MLVIERLNGKCYRDSGGLNVLAWTKDQGKSKSECLNYCREQGYPYAGIEQGGKTRSLLLFNNHSSLSPYHRYIEILTCVSLGLL